MRDFTIKRKTPSVRIIQGIQAAHRKSETGKKISICNRTTIRNTATKKLDNFLKSNGTRRRLTITHRVERGSGMAKSDVDGHDQMPTDAIRIAKLLLGRNHEYRLTILETDVSREF